MQAAFPGVEFLRILFKFKKRKENCRRMSTSSIKRQVSRFHVVVVEWTSKGNLRTTTKFTTTTSVDWERTGTRTSVSAGKRKLDECKHKGPVIIYVKRGGGRGWVEDFFFVILEKKGPTPLSPLVNS